MRVVICGGHLAPALAVIEKLKGDEILYIGRKYALEGDKALSLEYQTITSLNIPFANISTGRLQRKFTRFTISSFLKIPSGLISSFIILKKFKPNIVLGLGGYVSVPVAFAASILGIPVVIHEQTLEAGSANRLVSALAGKICISWQTSEKFFPRQKIVLTGNPVREEITKLLNVKTGKLNTDYPTVYITGGSLGSHTINLLVEGCLEKLLKIANIIHQTGDASEFTDFERLIKLKEQFNSELKNRYLLAKFFSPDKVAGILSSSDLIVGRSGINTVTELMLLEKPAYLIPLSFTQKDEQKKNALFLKTCGLAELGNQLELNPDTFFEHIKEMLKKIDQYKISSNFKANFKKNAAERIVKILRQEAKRN